MSYIYASTAFATLEAAQRAAVYDYVSAGGLESDALDYLSTLTSADVVLDMVRDQWRIPGVDLATLEGLADAERIVTAIRIRLTRDDT